MGLRESSSHSDELGRNAKETGFKERFIGHHASQDLFVTKGGGPPKNDRFAHSLYSEEIGLDLSGVYFFAGDIDRKSP